MTKDEILKKHEDYNEYHFHQVDREWIMKAMQEYADEQLRLYSVVSSFLRKEAKILNVDVDDLYLNLHFDKLYLEKSDPESYYLDLTRVKEIK
jgi:hypothetical protein